MRSFPLWVLGAAASLGCSSGSADPGQGQAAAGASANAGATSAGASSGGNSSAGGNATQGGASGTPQGGSDTMSTSGSSAGGGSAGNGGSAGGVSGGAGGSSSCPTSTPAASVTPTQCPASAGSTPPDLALAAVNDLRSHMGLPCMALVTEVDISAQKHCDYYQQNLPNKTCIANAHVEVDSCAGFVAASFDKRMTMAGYTGSPRSEVMAFSGDPNGALGQWINSVYHRTPLLSPWIREMGYGMTADCDTIDMGQGPKTPDDATGMYPYPNQVGVPISFDGSHEGPMPPVPPSGWPSAAPVHLYIKAFTVTSHDIFVKDSCAALPHQWLPDKEQDILYADKPFMKGTEYRVVITGTKAGQPLTFDWTFKTQ